MLKFHRSFGDQKVVPPETDLFDASYVVAFTRSALAEWPVGAVGTVGTVGAAEDDTSKLVNNG